MVYDGPVQTKREVRKENDLSLINKSKSIKRKSSFILLMALSLCLFSTQLSQASIDRYKKLQVLVDYQLTDKQYKCHNEIVFRESTWNHKAIGNKGGTKQAYGLYQMKIKSMRVAIPELQFWKYWEYVSHRYGMTQYDEPNYCNALHHLKTKGWQ